MPFRVPADFRDWERGTAYDLFGIGKEGDKLWIRKVKAFFKFGWNRAKLTDAYIKNTLLGGANKDLATRTLAANPKWLSRTKDLTVTTAIYAGLGESEIEALEQTFKVDYIFKMIHGKRELAAQALETFKLEGEENKAKLQVVLDKAIRKGDVDLIEVLAKTHEKLDWKKALTRCATLPKIPDGKRCLIVDAILTNVGLNKVFADGKELAGWMKNRSGLIIGAFIPHIGDLRDSFVEQLDSSTLQICLNSTLPSYVLTEEQGKTIGAMEIGKLKTFVKDILGAKYVLKHWGQLESKERGKYLSSELQAGFYADASGLQSFFIGDWLSGQLSESSEKAEKAE